MKAQKGGVSDEYPFGRRAAAKKPRRGGGTAPSAWRGNGAPAPDRKRAYPQPDLLRSLRRGKTTVARIIAASTGKLLRRLNGTTCGTADLKEVFDQRDTLDGRSGILLYLDEIQYLNKKQQQTLLESIEDGASP